MTQTTITVAGKEITIEIVRHGNLEVSITDDMIVERNTETGKVNWALNRQTGETTKIN